MKSSEKATTSAPSCNACARAARARSRLPVTSPTTGLSCATAMATRSSRRSFIAKVCRSLRAGDGRQRLRRERTLGLQEIGEQECEVERLLGVEPGIAHRVVAVVEILIADRTRPTGAFGDILPRHFQMYATGIGAFSGMHLEKRPHLLEDLIERPRLVPGHRGNSVAVHGVARPHNVAALAFNRAHKARQMLGGLVGAHAANQRQAAGLIVGIEDVDELEQLIRLLRRTSLQAERISDTAAEFNMGVVALPGAITDPQHVAGRAVQIPRRGIDAGEGLFEAEQ